MSFWVNQVCLEEKKRHRSQMNAHRIKLNKANACIINYWTKSNGKVASSQQHQSVRSFLLFFSHRIANTIFTIENPYWAHFYSISNINRLDLFQMAGLCIHIINSVCAIYVRIDLWKSISSAIFFFCFGVRPTFWMHEWDVIEWRVNVERLFFMARQRETQYWIRVYLHVHIVYCRHNKILTQNWRVFFLSVWNAR